MTFAASQEAAGQSAPDPYGPYVVRSLGLSLPEKLGVGERAAVTVEGYAYAGDELSVFVDLKGRDCPAAASDQPARSATLVSGPLGVGAFRVEEDYTPRSAGDRSFCAYLGPSSGQAGLQASEGRSVTARRLRASAARRTVVTALKRHNFARRVVKSLRINCRRVDRSVFSCRFFDGIPNYRLKGRGRVRLGVDLSYGFRVTAQGVNFMLTDDNEQGSK